MIGVTPPVKYVPVGVTSDKKSEERITKCIHPVPAYGRTLKTKGITSELTGWDRYYLVRRRALFGG